MQKIAQLTGHNSGIYILTNGRDERHFISAAGDGWVVEWNLDDPEMGRLIAKVDAQIFSLCYLPSENVLVAGNMNGGVHWVDLEDEKNNRNVAHHTKGVYGICQVGEHVFSIGGDGKLTRWSITEKRTIESYQLANQSLRSIVYSHKRNELAVGSSDNSIYFLNAESLELKHTIRDAHDNSVFALRYFPDGMKLISGSRDAHLKIWNLDENFTLEHSIPAHMFTINDIVFHPDGHLFATGSRDKSIKIWNAKNLKLIKVLEGLRDGGHFNSVNRLLWMKSESMLVSASDDRSMILWRA